MTEPAGLDAVFIANRGKLLRFLAAQGAGDAAEDLLQELWLRVAAARTGSIAAPLNYCLIYGQARVEDGEPLPLWLSVPS